MADTARAAGAEDVVQEARYAHLIGGARMSDDPATSVVDRYGRAHEVPNLIVCDGSILPTQGAANPALTIQALAARTSDYLIAEREAVLSRAARFHPKPPVRYDLSPPGTAGRGVPRLKSATPRVEVSLGGLGPGSNQ